MTKQEGGENQWQQRAKPKERPRKALRPSAAAEGNAFLGTEASRQLCQDISDISGGTCFLGFSRGKDSIAAWLYLREFFKTIIPFHVAAVPHLSFVDKSLDYYEKFFGTKIIRCLSGEVQGAIRDLIFQPLEDEEEIDNMELWQYDNHDIINLLREEYGRNVWCAFGISLNDSISRRAYIQRNRGRNEKWKTFYPCFDWKKEQILEIIDMAGVKLPPDYKLANRSLAGIPNFRHLYRMNEVFPQDMERIEALFPFIRAQLARNEFRLEKAQAVREQERVQCGADLLEQNRKDR